MTIKVMVIDDSSVVRQVISDLLAPCRDIEVIATAADPIFAMNKMRSNWPDVILLDVEMPRMDGISFLRQIMTIRPTPVVICSSHADPDSGTSMDAIAAGAVDIIHKPALGIRNFLHNSAADLISAIRGAAETNPVASLSSTSAVDLFPETDDIITTVTEPVSAGDLDGSRPAPRLSADVILDPPDFRDVYIPLTAKIVAIGASTGGPQALEQVLAKLSPGCPGIVIVQHMPEKFTASFASRLHTLSAIEVKEAAHFDLVLPGRALVARGGSHLLVKRDGGQYYVEVVNGPLVSRHKPSVDVLFRSVAKAAGHNAVGIIMTGMGDDGASGMRELRDCGAVTYAQDQESCMVYGMPKEAVLSGGVSAMVALERIAYVIGRYAN